MLIWRPHEVWRSVAIDSAGTWRLLRTVSFNLLWPPLIFTWPTASWLSCCSQLLPLCYNTTTGAVEVHVDETRRSSLTLPYTRFYRFFYVITLFILLVDYWWYPIKIRHLICTIGVSYIFLGTTHTLETFLWLWPSLGRLDRQSRFGLQRKDPPWDPGFLGPTIVH